MSPSWWGGVGMEKGDRTGFFQNSWKFTSQSKWHYLWNSSISFFNLIISLSQLRLGEAMGTWCCHAQNALWSEHPSSISQWDKLKTKIAPYFIEFWMWQVFGILINNINMFNFIQYFWILFSYRVQYEIFSFSFGFLILCFFISLLRFLFVLRKGAKLASIVVSQITRKFTETLLFRFILKLHKTK